MSTTGGCQCGAIRYAFDRPARNAHLCHCRMCQKAAGSYFLPLANVDRDDFRVTRGAIAHFASSDYVRRGFCRDCGTPLTFESTESKHLNVTLGSLDDPAAVRPEGQDGVEGRMPWFADLPALEEDDNREAEGEWAERLRAIAATNHQHPDHDTDVWPAPQSSA